MTNVHTLNVRPSDILLDRVFNPASDNDLGGATPRATRQSPKKSSAPIEIKQENRESSRAAPKSNGQSYGQAMNGVGVDMDERGLGQY